MNIKKILFYILIICNVQIGNATSPATIQRYAWIGRNDDGTVVALMLSHFGPSSRAPFVKMIVKTADKAEPLFVDTAMKMTGGEKELSELRLYLLNKNREYLQSLGIIFSNSNDFIPEANAISLTKRKSNLVFGWTDIENVGISTFAIRSYKSDTCPENSQGIALDIHLDGKKRLTAKPAVDQCWEDGFLLRNIFRTKKALWFVLNKHAYGLENADTYWIDVQGVTF